MLETLGRDLSRTLLIYTSLYVPPELRSEFKYTEAPTQAKSFKEDVPIVAESINKLLLAELSQNKDLIKLGDGNSSSGSDSAPSDGNLDPQELMKNLPTVEKSLKNK